MYQVPQVLRAWGGELKQDHTWKTIGQNDCEREQKSASSSPSSGPRVRPCSYSNLDALTIARPFGPLKAGKPHHAAFEVESMDTAFTGHEYLSPKCHKAFLRVGRHIEGSRVFDCRFDMGGFVMEHYAGGGLVNVKKEVSFVAAVSLGPPKAGANGHSEGHSKGQANGVQNPELQAISFS